MSSKSDYYLIFEEMRKSAINNIGIENGIIVFTKKDLINGELKDSTEFNRYLKHCDNEKESRTIKEIRIIEPYATGIFYKNSTCALFAAGLARTILMMKKLKQIIITGCCTDICILNFAIALRNFLDELNIDIEIIVPINAVETYHIPSIHDRKEYNERAYKVMEDGGITLVKEMKGTA